MTQFLILTGEYPTRLFSDGVSLTPLEGAPLFYRECAKNFLSAKMVPHSWILEKDGFEYADDLCCRAAEEISKGNDFLQSDLAILLKTCLPYSEQVSFWYASYCTDLDEFPNEDAFLQNVQKELQDSSVEVYSVFKRARS